MLEPSVARTLVDHLLLEENRRSYTQQNFVDRGYTSVMQHPILIAYKSDMCLKGNIKI